MTDPSRPTVHASAVVVGGRGVLVTGAPGSGKSSLVLALIEDPRGDSRLVADDRVVIDARDGKVFASAPEALAQLIEVRGVGVVRRPYKREAAIALVVELRPQADCPRLPDDTDRTTAVSGIALPRLILPAGSADAPLRLRVALADWLS